MSKSKILLVLGLVLVLAGLVVFVWLNQRDKETTITTDSGQQITFRKPSWGDLKDFTVKIKENICDEQKLNELEQEWTARWPGYEEASDAIEGERTTSPDWPTRQDYDKAKILVDDLPSFEEYKAYFEDSSQELIAEALKCATAPEGFSGE